LSKGCIDISEAVRNAATLNLRGAIDHTNIQGETVQKLDDLSNTILLEACKNEDSCAAFVSEETDGIALLNQNGKYVVAIDPLDGSSNIDIAAPVGTIFAIWERISNPGKDAENDDYMQSGEKCVAAGFALYGSATLLILTIRNGVHLFSFNTTSNQFELIEENLQIPITGAIYSLNQANLKKFDERAERFVNECIEGEKAFSLRYIGSMVGDLYRTLLKGGVFLYPAAKGTTKGKLRLLYECIPMSLIVEQAGGQSTNGQVRILEITPQEIHERCAIIIGSETLVKKYLAS
jgi:fructose-1,6-bisphosphatase I